MTTTTYLELDDQATGANNNTWGDVADANMAILEQAIARNTSIATTGGTTTITSSQNRFPIIRITGALVSNATITVRTAEKNWIFINATTGSYTVTVKTSAGSGKTLPRGREVKLYCDGTNVEYARERGVPAAQAGGTVDAITATFEPPTTSAELQDGTLWIVEAAGANTSTTPTFNPDGLGALTIKKNGGQALAAGDIRAAGHKLLLCYDSSGGHVELLNPANVTPLFFDISGNVGIGTSSPTSGHRLNIADATAKTQVTSTTGTNLAYSAWNNTGGTAIVGLESSVGGGIFAGTSAYSMVVGHGGGYPLSFSTSNTERMRIDSSGNVIVGGTSAVYGAAGRGVVTINGSSTALLGFTQGGVDRGFLYHDGANFVLNNTGAAPLLFQTNSTERMRIDASGNVGIGTSPSAKLHVSEGDAIIGRTTGVAQLNTNSGSVGAFLHANSGGVGSVGTSSNHALWLSTNNTQRATLGTDGSFVLTSSGGLGYGTGSGGTVTQITSKATGVTINKTNGQIITHNASLGAASEVSFTVTNSTVAATDNIILTKVSGGTATRYQLYVGAVAAGSFVVSIRNVDSTAQSDVITFNFAVIKSVTS